MLNRSHGTETGAGLVSCYRHVDCIDGLARVRISAEPQPLSETVYP